LTTDGGVRATSWPAVPAGPTAGAARAGADADRLLAALQALRAHLHEARFELPVRGSEDAARTASALASQVDDYLVPRLSRPDTPPLLVIGGSTGGGKSTLLNTLVGEPVSPAGVLRPTTRSPVLVCHPDDFGTFLVGGPLPSLPRSAEGAPGTLRVLESDAVPPGVALVDAPDVDSVEAENRRLAVRLLDAADLWIFVTTAARYADAVPWELLRAATKRGAAVLIVLSRVNHLAHATVSTHLRELLREEGLGAAPLFVVEQVALEEHGLLPEQAIRSLRMWTSRLSASPARRNAVIRTTITGTLATISDRVDTVADATKDQRGAVATLRGQIGQVYGAAEARLRAAVEDGVLFRGDVVGRWQEYAGNGGLTAITEARAGGKNGVLTGQASIRAARVRAGLVGGVVRLFTSVADEAAGELVTAWRKNPGGAAAAEPCGDRASAEAPKRAEDVARAWLDGVDASIARADGSMRAGVMPVVVAAALQEGTLPVGREVDVPGGTVTLSPELLAEIFEDEGVRTAARVARADLLERLAGALALEQQRFVERLNQLEPLAGLPDRLRDAARVIDRHRHVVDDLFRDPAPDTPSPQSDPSPPVTPSPPSDPPPPASAQDEQSPPARSATPPSPEVPSTRLGDASALAALQAVAGAVRPALTLDLRPAGGETKTPGGETGPPAGGSEAAESAAAVPAVSGSGTDPDDGASQVVDRALNDPDATNVDRVSTDAARAADDTREGA